MDSTSWLRGRAVRAAPAHLHSGATVVRRSDRSGSPRAAAANEVAQLATIEKEPRAIAMMRNPPRAYQCVDATSRARQEGRCALDVKKAITAIRVGQAQPLSNALRELVNKLVIECD